MVSFNQRKISIHSKTGWFFVDFSHIAIQKRYGTVRWVRQGKIRCRYLFHVAVIGVGDKKYRTAALDMGRGIREQLFLRHQHAGALHPSHKLVHREVDRILVITIYKWCWRYWTQIKIFLQIGKFYKWKI
jgi:hypothetical protein